MTLRTDERIRRNARGSALPDPAYRDPAYLEEVATGLADGKIVYGVSAVGIIRVRAQELRQGAEGHAELIARIEKALDGMQSGHELPLLLRACRDALASSSEAGELERAAREEIEQARMLAYISSSGTRTWRDAYEVAEFDRKRIESDYAVARDQLAAAHAREQRVRELITEWRRQASSDATGAYSAGYDEAHGTLADDLEAALTPPDAQEAGK